MSEALTLPFVTAPAPMTPDEARSCIEGIKKSLSSARAALLGLHRREGWRSLGYASWRACAVAEFGVAERTVYQELRAAIIEGELCAFAQNAPVAIGTIPESHLRPLGTLCQTDRPKAWERAQEIAGAPERLTGAIVQRAVEEIRQDSDAARFITPQERQEADQRITRVEFIPLPDLEHTGITPLLAKHPDGYKADFNRTNNNVEWALWTWNPVTGCLHDCKYCYARDIANHWFEQKFVPTFLPARLPAPRLMKPPDPRKVAVPFRSWTDAEGRVQCEGGIGEKNVFVCSMADLFGKWVPREWIQAVLDEVIAAPQWNFLFLTKFPQRLCEFEWPANAWVGTTVDRQYRVDIAEKAFRKVTAGVKWLSCEPLLEPLRFSSLEMFDWVVVGGSSKSTQTPEFQPPREWVTRLHAQALDAGCKWYEKTNLLPERVREYPGGLT